MNNFSNEHNCAWQMVLVICSLFISSISFESLLVISPTCHRVIFFSCCCFKCAPYKLLQKVKMFSFYFHRNRTTLEKIHQRNRIANSCCRKLVIMELSQKAGNSLEMSFLVPGKILVKMPMHRLIHKHRERE